MAVTIELNTDLNRIGNWSFETDITTGWTTGGWVTAERSATFAKFGTYSAHFADATFDGNEIFSTDITPGIVVGREYEASLWLKKVTCTGTGLMIVQWYTDADAFISQTALAFDAGTHDWQKYTITATAPATAAKVLIYAFFFTGVTIGTAFDAYIDGVRFSVAPLDLMAADEAGLRMEVWNQAVASPVYGGQPGPIKETMDLIVVRASHDTLAASIQALDYYRVQADAYMRDRTTADPVWLECKMDDETGTRRTLVMSIDEGYRLPLYADHHGPPQDTTRIRLVLWRMPWWEDPEITAATEASPTAGASVVYDYTAGGGDIAGDIPARISDSMMWRITHSVGELDRLWMGIRSANKRGTLANFANIWECEDGTNGTDAADVVEAQGSGGNVVRITPGTATWANRMSITLADVTADYADNLGLYLWLLRWAATGAGVWEIQFRFGYTAMTDDRFVRGPIVEVTGSGLFDIVEMGIASIPMRNIHTLGFGFLDKGAEQLWTIQIWARRTGGAGVLELDCLCPIPIDESWMQVAGADVDWANATHYDYVAFGQSPEGQFQVVTAWNNAGIQTLSAVPTSTTDGTRFSLPPGDGRAYVVYARESTTVITDVISLLWKHYDRWASLRGAE